MEPELLLAIITGARRALPKHACASPGVRCLYYDDDDAPRNAAASATFHHAPTRGYTRFPQPPLPQPPGPLQCCDAAFRGRPPLANGSNRYFCRAHIKATLSAQYRFLPALAHAAKVVAATPSLQWLALVDDDSHVDADRLLDALRAPVIVAHAQRGGGLYLGDFGPATHGVWTGKVTFACGGGGTVFDRAAALKLDFLQCARRLHSKCAQSDWMIGECARRGGVLPMGGRSRNLSWTSCGFCAAGCSSKMRARILATIRRYGSAVSSAVGPARAGPPGCIFAQQTPATLCRREEQPSFVQAACGWRAPTVAIRHGWCDCSQPTCKKGGPAILRNAPVSRL